MTLSPSVTPFDFSALRTLCARWHSEEVPLTTVADSLLDRVRQVLSSIRVRAADDRTVDLISLLRQILLSRYHASSEGTWLRVPLAKGWPTAEQWRTSH